MGLNANNAGNANFKREILDAGVFPGRLVQVIDYGLQTQRPYLGQEKPPMQEIGLTYELADEFMKDEEGKDIPEKPRWISETLPFHNVNADRAKSTQRYRAMDPDNVANGDFGRLLGTPINITIAINEGTGKNKGKKFENVAGLAPMRAKEVEKLPKLVNVPKFFDLDKPDLEVFKSFPKWVQDKIKSNLNFNGSPLAVLLGENVVEAPKEPVEDNEPPY